MTEPIFIADQRRLLRGSRAANARRVEAGAAAEARRAAESAGAAAALAEARQAADKVLAEARGTRDPVTSKLTLAGLQCLAEPPLPAPTDTRSGHPPEAQLTSHLALAKDAAASTQADVQALLRWRDDAAARQGMKVVFAIVALIVVAGGIVLAVQAVQAKLQAKALVRSQATAQQGTAVAMATAQHAATAAQEATDVARATIQQATVVAQQATSAAQATVQQSTASTQTAIAVQATVPSATATAHATTIPTATPSMVATTYTAVPPTAMATSTPRIVPTSTPRCAVAVDVQLASAWARDVLGCAQVASSVVWGAWESFEQGYMWWRYDTKRVTVLYSTTEWVELADQWNQVDPIGSRGTPPAGKQAPIRGFGYVWGWRDDVWNGLGWALEEEKGFCATVQAFEQGLILRSNSIKSCNDDLFNWATVPSFGPWFFVLQADGRWRSVK